MQILNKFPWAQALGQRLAECAPQLRSLPELQKLSLPEVNWAAGQPLVSKTFRPDRPFNFNADAQPISVETFRPGNTKKVVLSFNASDCLSNISILPVTQRKQTLGILRLQLQKILPMAADSYLVGWHELDRTDQLSRIEHFVLKSASLDDAIGQLVQNGYEPAAIAFRHDSQSAIPIALLRDGTEFGEQAHNRWLKRAVGGLLAILLAGWMIGGARSLWLSENLTVLENQSAQLLTEIQSMKAIEAETEKQMLTLSAARNVRNSRYPVTSVIEELAKITPDHTYFTRILVDGETLSIDGLSGQPESLVALLEQSPIFANVSFTAAVFRNPGESQSRFSIQMVLERALAK